MKNHNHVFLLLGLLMYFGSTLAQNVEAGVTSIGKEVDCSTINPSVDKAVDEYGRVVLAPRVTRNGKLLTPVCAVIPEIFICEDNDFGEIHLTGLNDVVKVEILNSSNEIVATDNSPAVGKAFERLPSGIYTVRAFSSTGHSATQTANIIKNYTHCTVSHINPNEMGATSTQLDSVRDHQGNWYEVVQIGSQCWLRDNMRATTSPSTGSKITMDKIFSYSSKSAAWYENDSTKYSKYGVLYNWCAAVDTFYAANGEPELANRLDTIYWPCDLSAGPRRGICPEGWHMPTDDEWHVLEQYVLTNYDTHVDPYAGHFNGQWAGKLAIGCDWDPEGALATAPGNYSYVERNSTGFSAHPAGVYYQEFGDLGLATMFWSATNPTDAEAYSRTLFSDLEGVRKQLNGRQDGFSVRCVRNN